MVTGEEDGDDADFTILLKEITFARKKKRMHLEVGKEIRRRTNGSERKRRSSKTHNQDTGTVLK